MSIGGIPSVLIHLELVWSCYKNYPSIPAYVGNCMEDRSLRGGAEDDLPTFHRLTTTSHSPSWDLHFRSSNTRDVCAC